LLAPRRLHRLPCHAGRSQGATQRRSRESHREDDRIRNTIWVAGVVIRYLPSGSKNNHIHMQIGVTGTA
jgi:hypothetical protein